jgi:hypothetical protein
MNISLTPKTRRFVERQVKTGRYQNAGDVVNAASQGMEMADGLAGAPADFAVLSDLNGADVEAMAFIVMMEATNAAGGVRLKPCDVHRGKIDSYDQLVVIRDRLKDQLDSMSEMSEVTSLRLQMAMDRRSRYMETLANLMKKMSATADTLVQNLK